LVSNLQAPGGMFAVLVKPCESRMVLPGREWTLPNGVRKIAEYCGSAAAGVVVLVEVAAGAGPSLREMESRGRVTALSAGNLEQGFEIARSMIEQRPRPTSCFRHRSGSR